jgi:hypothetical protein
MDDSGNLEGHGNLMENGIFSFASSKLCQPVQENDILEGLLKP